MWAPGWVTPGLHRQPARRMAPRLQLLGIRASGDQAHQAGEAGSCPAGTGQRSWAGRGQSRASMVDAGPAWTDRAGVDGAGPAWTEQGRRGQQSRRLHSRVLTRLGDVALVARWAVHHLLLVAVWPPPTPCLAPLRALPALPPTRKRSRGGPRASVLTGNWTLSGAGGRGLHC